MKKFLILIGLISNISFSYSQKQIEIAESDVVINTALNNTISYTLEFKLKEGYRHRQEIFNFNNQGVNAVISLHTESKETKTNYRCRINPAHKGLEFKLDADSMLVNKILSGEANYFVETDKDFVIEVIKDGKDTIKFILTKEQVKKATQKMILSEDEQKEMIESLGGTIKLVENNIDLGLIPDDESSSGNTEYYVDFSYSNNYSIKKIPLTISAKGLLSTNPEDSLNYLEIYPVGYKLDQGKSEFSFNLGLEANQVFSNYRVTGDIYWQGVIPNLIDLTYSENRLRLKPVVKAGIKLYREIENNRPDDDEENVFSNMIYADIYYYIPVMKVYSLILEGRSYYDFNTKTNPESELKYSYSITFGVEIPKTGLKTIFKYTNGERELDYTSANYFMIGLMADLFTL